MSSAPQPHPGKLDIIFDALDSYGEETAASEIRSALLAPTPHETAANRVNTILPRTSITGRNAAVSRGAVATWRSRNGFGCKPGSRVVGYDEAPAANRVLSQEQAQPRDAFDFDAQSGIGTATTNSRLDGAPARTVEDLLASHGFDPAEYEVVGETRISGWTIVYRDAEGELQERQGEAHRFRFVQRSAKELDLPVALALAEQSVTAYAGAPVRSNTVGVIVVSDAQIGKVDRRGGTQELLTRAEYVRGWLEEHAGSRDLAGLIVAEPGDLVEGEWSAGGLNTLIENDLKSPMAQLEVATSLMWRFTSTALALAPRVMYAAVPSNHAKWRRGGDLGRSHDDWGIAVAKQMATYADLKGESGRFGIAIPTDFDESVRVQVGHDVSIAMTHGHKLRGGVQGWYARQCANAHSPVAHTDVLITGHLHTPVEQIIGAGAVGRPTYHQQALSLDGGSSWFEQINGAATATPGALYFEIDKHEGYEPQTRRIITAPWDRVVAPEPRSTTNFFGD